MKAPRESDVLGACLQLLKLHGLFAWRNNSGGAYLSGGGGRKQFVRFGLVGSADVLGVLPPSGRLLAVETKREGNEPTAAQRAFLDAVGAAGGLALVVTDVRQLEEALRREGVIR